MAANVLRLTSPRFPARRPGDARSALLAGAALLFCGWFLLAVATGAPAHQPQAQAPVAVASAAR
jgi:hypothetical protein